MTPTPTQRRRQQTLARWTRRLPGYRVALDEVLPRVRRSATLSDLAWRVFAPRHGAGQVDVPMRAGRAVVGADVSRLPVVGILATGLDEPAAERLVDQVCALQRRLLSFRPLFVLDLPVFGAARRHDVPVELVVPRAVFARGAHGDPEGWEDHVARRVAGIVDHYQLWHLARADEGVLSPADERLLRVLGERLPRELQVHAADEGQGPG
ncbi:hypothetical protein AVL62_14310 [Serinicoccus chungangensis]|uniref:Uncharacterized protein n=1 Tax=Serinicoccus chungangensis TaxID=767452 RepID=A0A0W8I3K3_9MICO|nr:hypothetical protein [Serinicoccus chungangensis]KUG52494.1 hypothetical protein AVL62_14310 [Serinicoccus chungangensis]